MVVFTEDPADSGLVTVDDDSGFIETPASSSLFTTDEAGLVEEYGLVGWASEAPDDIYTAVSTPLSSSMKTALDAVDAVTLTMKIRGTWTNNERVWFGALCDHPADHPWSIARGVRVRRLVSSSVRRVTNIAVHPRCGEPADRISGGRVSVRRVRRRRRMDVVCVHTRDRGYASTDANVDAFNAGRPVGATIGVDDGNRGDRVQLD